MAGFDGGPTGSAAPASVAVLIFGTFAEVGTWAISAASSMTCLINSTTAQNDEASWEVTLRAGTYTLRLGHLANTSRPIYKIFIDGVAVNTLGGSAASIDGYAGSATASLGTITGIALTAGLHTIRILCDTKNASSGGYAAFLQSLTLLRTGA